jgi:cytochrome c-type biogenesis protein CcmF
LGFVLVAWVVSTTFVSLRTRLNQYDGSLWSKLKRQPRAYYGMLLAHFGIAVFIVGVTMVKGYEAEQDVRMDVGDTAHVGGYDFRYDGMTKLPGPNYEAGRATLKVTKGGRDITTLYPEKRIYRVQQNPMTEAAIDTRLTGDLYVALGEPLDPNNALGAWAVRIHLKPFVDWIWVGCILMGLGGLLAVLDRRYRVRVVAADGRERGHKPVTSTPSAAGVAVSRTVLPDPKP